MKTVPQGRGVVFSLCSLIKPFQLYSMNQFQSLDARVISVAAAGEEKLSPSAPPLMLVAGQQDVGHEDVATGSGVFSLRSLNEALQHYNQSSFNG